MKTRTAERLLRDQAKAYDRQLERKDEMIQSLLDRIQHPERTPVWREAPPEPLPDNVFTFELVPDPDQLP